MFLHLPSSQCSLPNSCGLHWPRSRVPPLADRLSIKLRRLRVQRQAVDRRLPGSVNLPVLFVSAAVANRVSNRVLLAPLLHHTYFLALTTTVAQLVVYLTWLKRRCRKGLVQDLMWSFAKRNPALITAFGMCEGAFFPLVFYSAARLPGSLVQVLNQTLIPSTVLLSCLFLRRRYDILQITGVAVVLAGVAAFTSFPRTSGSVAVVALCIAAYGLQAGAMVLKEVVFSRYQKNPAGSCAGHANDGIGGDRCLPFDPALFLTAGTGCRLLVQFLAWPVFQQLTQGLSLRSCFAAGFQAMQQPSVLPLVVFYIAANVALSITALLLVQKTSAAATVLANVVALPLSALVFCLPLPLLEQQAFHWQFALSLVLIVLGNLLYSHRSLRE
ncbi:unnamed protein product [Cladocopium goreaui]|uniref:Crt-like 1 n=1 Tax=Cladocopium goreaui TaxID=2562237 RepID=A0A9P1M039_9DINO|nr:unnamed protein product [Cladocopium goreaui]